MKTVTLKELPTCGFCMITRPNLPRRGRFDGPTKKGFHAYMCDKHYLEYGIEGSTITVRLEEPHEQFIADL